MRIVEQNKFFQKRVRKVEDGKGKTKVEEREVQNYSGNHILGAPTYPT